MKVFKIMILAMFIVVFVSTVNFAIVISKDDRKYSKEQRSQWVTADEFNKWQEDMQRWFDTISDQELLAKVASRSEAHGYVRPEGGGKIDDEE